MPTGWAAASESVGNAAAVLRMELVAAVLPRSWQTCLDRIRDRINWRSCARDPDRYGAVNWRALLAGESESFLRSRPRDLPPTALAPFSPPPLSATRLSRNPVNIGPKRPNPTGSRQRGSLLTGRCASFVAVQKAPRSNPCYEKILSFSRLLTGAKSISKLDSAQYPCGFSAPASFCTVFKNPLPFVSGSQSGDDRENALALPTFADARGQELPE
jgi:hypothetical protein